MNRMILALICLSASASLAAAQEGKDKDMSEDNVLTPTDVLELGQVSLTGVIQVNLGTATIKDGTGTFDVDVDQEAYDLYFAGGVGLGKGFEIEASIPYQIRGIGKGEVGLAEFEEETYSIGDLTVQAIYRVLKEEKESPQWVVGAVVTAPTGYWKEGVAKITNAAGTVVQEGEKGGIGEGAWRYGLGTAISKRFGLFEPYVGVQYLLGGDAERKDVDYERPDQGQVFAGAELHVSKDATIDLRGIVDFVGEGVRTENNVDKTEEQHQNYTVTAALYARLAPGVTLLVGGGVYTSQDHWIDKEGQIEIEGLFGYYMAVGLHVMLGLK
jgi:hypothetical protein